jgi:hypothetical protein
LEVAITYFSMFIDFFLSDIQSTDEHIKTIHFSYSVFTSSISFDSFYLNISAYIIYVLMCGLLFA